MENRNRSTRRQAVVIIHGMGEQAPMATLRGFVQGITAWIKNFDNTRDKPRCWSRPDSISELYETRKITMEAFEGNLKTDFYEFYWAHHMRDTSFSHLFAWVKAVALTPVKKVPPRLKNIWWSFWAIIFLIAIGALLAFINKTHIETWVEKYWKHTALLALLLLVVKWLFPNVIMKFVKQIALDYAGDVARYLNPKTYNIAERSTIRREGINFLKKLHDRTEKKYEKIIVVGHSLGSVVAYDLVRLLWQEYHESFEFSPDIDHKIFEEMARVSRGEKPIDDIDAFRNLQQQCREQYRNNGNKWLISDFITCAPAVAHLDYFLQNGVPFEQLAKTKEMPVCPSAIEAGDRSLLFDRQTLQGKDADGNDIKRTVEFLNHAALFSVTRWTNIFFSSDFVGSKASRIFGSGVKDIEVPRKSFFLLPGGHTDYWEPSPDNKALAHIAQSIGFKQVIPPGKTS